MDHLMAERVKKSKGSQMGQVTQNKYLKKKHFKCFSNLRNLCILSQYVNNIKQFKIQCRNLETVSNLSILLTDLDADLPHFTESVETKPVRNFKTAVTTRYLTTLSNVFFDLLLKPTKMRKMMKSEFYQKDLQLKLQNKLS